MDVLAVFRKLKVPPPKGSPLISLAWDHFPRKSSAEGYIYLGHLLTERHQVPDIHTAIKVGSFSKGIGTRVGKYRADIADRQWCSDAKLKRLILAVEKASRPVVFYLTPIKIHPLAGLVTREAQVRQQLQAEGYNV